jgi:hypothetical protein
VRRTTTLARRLRAAPLLALLVLAFPGSAIAHSGSATVSCTGADFSFVRFLPGDNTVNYRVTIDSQTFREGTFALDQNGGRSGALHAPYTLSGTHVVQAYAWWGPQGVEGNHYRPKKSPALAYQKITCETPPSPPTAPTPPGPPSSPPLAPVTTAPATGAPPAATGTGPAVGQPGAQGVAGEQAVSASARLAVPSRCTSRVVRVRVTGRQIRSVAVSVAGRHVRTVSVSAGRRSVTIPVAIRSSGAARQAVEARVTFRNGAPARTLQANATRCAQTAVQPQFTG